MLRALLTGAVLSIGVSLGWQLRGTWALWGETRVEARTVRIVAQQAAISARADAAYAASASQSRTVYRTLYREIPVHVPPEAVARCDVPVGFVRLHDAAAQGLPAVPDPAGRPDAAASGVGLDRVAEVVVDNYQACSEVRAQLSALQAWIGEQIAVE